MLFPAKVGQEIRPMNKLSDKRIDLKTHCERTREYLLLYMNTPLGR